MYNPLLAPMIAFGVATSAAHAAPVSLTVDFTASDPIIFGTSTISPPSIVTGSFSATYDDSFAAPGGADFSPIIDSLSITFEGTTYSVSSAVGLASWDTSGVFGRFRVGGSLNGISGVNGATTDFLIEYTKPTWTATSPTANFAIPSQNAVYVYGTVEFEVVPAPSTLAGLGLTLALARRRRGPASR